MNFPRQLKDRIFLIFELVVVSRIGALDLSNQELIVYEQPFVPLIECIALSKFLFYSEVHTLHKALAPDRDVLSRKDV